MDSVPPLELPAGIDSIYDVLGMRWFWNGGYDESPIDKGVFERYQRKQTPEMPYIGTARSAVIRSLIGQANRLSTLSNAPGGSSASGSISHPEFDYTQ